MTHVDSQNNGIQAGTVTIANAENTGAVWLPQEGQETRDLIDNFFRGREDPPAMRSIIDSSTAILTRCTNPRGAARTETGLVIGYVQSGKTLSFTTVSTLARDNAFQMVIVMAGISTPLYEQSAGRLRQDLRLDTPRSRRWIPISNPKAVHLRTLQDILRDWRDDTTPLDQKLTALIMVMKNHTHLANLRNLLGQLELSRCPVLIIDDEADQASMNTKVNQARESTTYRRISEIRRSIPHHTFIQYTATPQAPLLISLIDTLSPNFIRVLNPGADYVGGREFFVDLTRSHVRPIPTAELAVEPADAEGPPESLLEALRTFAIGVACSYAASNTNPSGNRSMLVHPSHLTDRHSIYAGWIANIKSDWDRLLERPETAAAQEILEEFRGAYNSLRQTELGMPTFEAVRLHLPRAIRLTRVQEVNSSRGRTPPVPWSDAYSWILIAGQAVDRGFTVEGLTVTYMPRGIGVGNADTLQQRGRFFGYKRRYLGLCRIYLPQDVIDAFQEYVEHEEDVRNQLVKYQEPGKSLNDWKRAFIMSPNLRPTRQNVLQLDYMRGLLSDDWLSPAYLASANDVIEFNRELIENFLNRLPRVPDEGHAQRTPAQRHRVAFNVRLDTVLEELLIPYKVPASTDGQKFTGLLLQIRRALDRNEDEVCDVYQMRPTEISEYTVQDGGRVPNIFQGAYPVEEARRGSIYPGDRSIRSNEDITIQLRSLRLIDSDGNERANRVPVVSAWVPSRLGAGWIVQDDD